MKSVYVQQVHVGGGLLQGVSGVTGAEKGGLRLEVKSSCIAR